MSVALTGMRLQTFALVEAPLPAKANHQLLARPLLLSYAGDRDRPKYSGRLGGGFGMSTSIQPYRAFDEGQIALERALFCLECELIFAGSTCCPRCADGAVWPLNQWLPSARAFAPILPNREVGLADHGLRVIYLEEKLSNR